MLETQEKAGLAQTVMPAERFSGLKRFVFSFRPEEFIALVFFWPMAYLTIKAYLFFLDQGHVPNVFKGDMKRLIAVVIIIIIAYVVARFKPGWSFLRDILPFGYCLAIYTNLHDTVHFANSHDIQDSLIAIDQWLFGVQPCVWAQQFFHPALTDIFSFCYMIFFLFAPVVAAVLLLKRNRAGFRKTLVTVILCFYCGYFLYVVFPAIPPRIALKPFFYIDFQGSPIYNFEAMIFSALPQDSRCAFPSLHSAVTLLSLIFAWKYSRITFWLILPFCLGLFLSTVYLRHHYVIDLIAGWALGVLAYYAIPKFDVWWRLKMDIYSPRNRIAL